MGFFFAVFFFYFFLIILIFADSSCLLSTVQRETEPSDANTGQLLFHTDLLCFEKALQTEDKSCKAMKRKSNRLNNKIHKIKQLFLHKSNTPSGFNNITKIWTRYQHFCRISLKVLGAPRVLNLFDFRATLQTSEGLSHLTQRQFGILCAV